MTYAQPSDAVSRRVGRFRLRYRVDEDGCWIWTGALHDASSCAISNIINHKRWKEVVNG